VLRRTLELVDVIQIALQPYAAQHSTSTSITTYKRWAEKLLGKEAIYNEATISSLQFGPFTAD